MAAAIPALVGVGSRAGLPKPTWELTIYSKPDKNNTVPSLLKKSILTVLLQYLSAVAVRLSQYCLAALLHGWRRWRRRREALRADSRYLKQWHGRVEVHGDLRGHGVRCSRLQGDWQGSSWALHGVVRGKNIQLRGVLGDDGHNRHGSVTRDCRCNRLTFRGIWRIKKTKLVHEQVYICCSEITLLTDLLPLAAAPLPVGSSLLLLLSLS